MTQQSQIDTESAAGKLLRTIAQFGYCPCEAITPGAKWLLDRQYCYRANSRLYMTEPNPKANVQGASGRDYYEGCCRNPSMTKNPRAWTEEARNGLTVKRGRLGMVSARSSITRAAVPTLVPPHTTRTPEDEANDNEQFAAARKKLCADLEITEAELHALMDEQRIQQCDNGCKTIAVFDKRGDGGLQHLCRKCRRKRRAK